MNKQNITNMALSFLLFRLWAERRWLTNEPFLEPLILSVSTYLLLFIVLHLRAAGFWKSLLFRFKSLVILLTGSIWCLFLLFLTLSTWIINDHPTPIHWNLHLVIYLSLPLTNSFTIYPSLLTSFSIFGTLVICFSVRSLQFFLWIQVKFGSIPVFLPILTNHHLPLHLLLLLYVIRVCLPYLGLVSGEIMGWWFCNWRGGGSGACMEARVMSHSNTLFGFSHPLQLPFATFVIVIIERKLSPSFFNPTNNNLIYSSSPSLLLSKDSTIK